MLDHRWVHDPSLDEHRHDLRGLRDSGSRSVVTSSTLTQDPSCGVQVRSRTCM